MEIRTNINGQALVWDVNPSEILLDVLRREGFASVKFGCGQGDCGSCSVLVDGQLQRACLLFVGQVHERTITTAEGLGEIDKPHRLQTAFVKAGAVQCGYCTPGMLLASKALLDENSTPSEEDVREALDGNLCRCTGYKKIIEAVLDAAQGENQ
jgi:aerobic-type carbon monoxide dehydrogenase small subunit (CoxS/CutS family)